MRYLLKNTKHFKTKIIIHINNGNYFTESQEEDVRASLFSNFKFEGIGRHLLNFSKVIKSYQNRIQPVPEARVVYTIIRQFCNIFACLKKVFFKSEGIGD